jgi:hypothetical protein
MLKLESLRIKGTKHLSCLVFARVQRPKYTVRSSDNSSDLPKQAVGFSEKLFIYQKRSRGPGFDYRRYQIFWEVVGLGPFLWSSGQSSWLQIQRSVFDFRRYQIFWEVVGLDRGPLSLVSTTEKLLGRKSSVSGLESRDYGCGDPLRWRCHTIYPQELALISPTSGCLSVGTGR